MGYSVIKAKNAEMILDSLSPDQVFEMWPSRFSKMGKESCYCPEFYEIMTQQSKLEKNQIRMIKIERSQRVSYKTKINMNLFMDLLYDASWIYRKGLDNSAFDADVALLNKFVESHIVIRYGHRTFRRLNSFDINRKEYNEDGTLKTNNQKLNETLKTFVNMQKRFNKILNESKEKESQKGNE